MFQPSPQEMVWRKDGSVDAVLEIKPAKMRSSEPSAGGLSL